MPPLLPYVEKKLRSFPDRGDSSLIPPVIDCHVTWTQLDGFTRAWKISLLIKKIQRVNWSIYKECIASYWHTLNTYMYHHDDAFGSKSAWFLKFEAKNVCVMRNNWQNWQSDFQSFNSSCNPTMRDFFKCADNIFDDPIFHMSYERLTEKHPPKRNILVLLL